MVVRAALEAAAGIGPSVSFWSLPADERRARTEAKLGAVERLPRPLGRRSPAARQAAVDLGLDPDASSSARQPSANA